MGSGLLYNRRRSETGWLFDGVELGVDVDKRVLQADLEKQSWLGLSSG